MQIVEYERFVVSKFDFVQSNSTLQIVKIQQGVFTIRHYFGVPWAKISLNLGSSSAIAGRSSGLNATMERRRSLMLGGVDGCVCMKFMSVAYVLVGSARGYGDVE
jgi:hypothetical protein